ncbi:hypothetical protein PVL29_017550 [Vitis rotundifolia]|uniref:Uncharacterized protein n=1 Tax=Vitis rotundifolia TaxID=103349 RepID=A0AA39DHY5_VITRO|nr:hypothetical protein PVL29_017550 [Vitis rotundifolia]
MVGDYNISPDQEIYGCEVDLLGQSMPFKPDECVWGPFLGACKAHRFPNSRKLATHRILDLRPNMAGTYVMLSNIYAADGKWGSLKD